MVTSSDFTIDLTINKRVWNNWTKHINSIIECTSFKDHLRSEIIKLVKSEDPLWKGYSKDNVDIACISLAYDNTDLINLLLQRVNYISTG